MKPLEIVWSLPFNRSDSVQPTRYRRRKACWLEMKALVLVISADMPLLTAATLSRLVQTQASAGGPMTLLTVRSANPRGFGRIIRSIDGEVIGIVEEAQATADQLKIDELNVGAYCFSSPWLWQALKKIKLSPKGEYYLTDIVAVAVAEGKKVLAVTVEDEEEDVRHQ